MPSGEEGRVPPPVGSVEGLLDEGAEGLSTGEGSVGVAGAPPEGGSAGVAGAPEGDSPGTPEGAPPEGGSAGVAGASPVGAGEGLGASAGKGADGDGIAGALGDSLGAPPGGVTGGVSVGAPPVGAAGVVCASAEITMRPGPITEAPIARTESKNFEIFITDTLNFLVLSCETAYITLLNATHKILVHNGQQ